jgi:glutamate synthase (ferredoxin)
MTGGAVVVLGKAGRNFAAGMTGGIAYVLDTEGVFASEKYCGEPDKHLQDVSGASEAHLRQLIEQHHKATGSQRALRILQHWSAFLPLFWQVVPEGEADNALFMPPASAELEDQAGKLLIS